MKPLYVLSTAAGLIVVCALAALGFWGLPRYHVWQQGLSGEAELSRAMANRRIMIQEAEAKKEAAVMLADAEIARARGVAEANKIIGQSLHDNADYLKYLWIQELSTTNNHVIYVPTEANLPILESGRGVSRFPAASVEGTK